MNPIRSFEFLQDTYLEAVDRRKRHPVEVRVSTRLWTALSMRARDAAARWTREGNPVDWMHPALWLGERQRVVEAPAQVDPIVFVWAKKEAGECEHGERSEYECLPCMRVAYGKAKSEAYGYRRVAHDTSAIQQAHAANMNADRSALREAVQELLDVWNKDGPHTPIHGDGTAAWMLRRAMGEDVVCEKCGAEKHDGRCLTPP